MCCGAAPAYDFLYTIGLCSTSSFDLYYGWTGSLSSKSKKFELNGFTYNSNLIWDEEISEWKIIHLNNPYIFATCNQTESSSPLPIGIHHWYIFNDTCDDIENDQMVGKNIYKLPLSFVACNPNQYTCEDGTSWYALADI